MKSRSFSANRLLWLAALPALFSSSLQASPVGIVDWPLVTGTAVQIKPNLLFVLDDSGSMSWAYLPDTADDWDPVGRVYKSAKYCFRNHLYNKAYYNPDYTYLPPVKADGLRYPNANFTAAKMDGFVASLPSDLIPNLSNNFTLYHWYYPDRLGTPLFPKGAAHYYKYTGGTPNDGKTCYDNSRYALVTISSAAEKQNFANWYSYYRSRYLLMRSSVGEAFKEIDDSFRVGFVTIWGRSPVSVNDFSPAQKSAWYDMLYTAFPSGGTPLRRALADAGKMYAGRAPFGLADPVQYSCQQNFTLLSTDGYWNDEAGTKLDNSAIGNEDGSLSPPKKDTLGYAGGLADVAAYYNLTDLRTLGLGNCTGAMVGGSRGNVCGSVGKNEKQVMNTYTLALGIDGTIPYTPSYTTGGSPYFEQIKAGTRAWPNPDGGAKNIDDTWHAAVNGEGVYYSANTPETIAYSLRSALIGVAAASGSGGTPATSSLDPTAGDDKMFVPGYTSKKWDGDVSAYKIDLTTGALLPGKLWSAQATVDAASTRNILVANGSSLASFSTGSLSSAIAAKYFDVGPTNPNGQLSQYPTFNAASKTLATPASVIDFLKGNPTYEDKAGNPPDSRIYRAREHKLGDIVGSAPVYVKKPVFNYIDGGYSAFVSAKASRQGAVYVGANDGMLHAFNADTGAELWAFVPQAVIPNMYKLADKNYANNHKYYVDGSISVGDVCLLSACGAGDWKTILVGGLNKGGRGIFALDVTDPATPKLMWEIASTSPSFANLGFTFGKPLIAKRKNGGVWEWVVVFASGYDNESPGDGKGHVYVVKAADGALVGDMTTGISDASKSGIARLSGWADDATTNNAVRYVYGGDLSGNLWRFDIETMSAAKLAMFDNGGPQPITAAPELGEVLKQGVKYRVIFVGTGKYLGLSDITDASPQTMYAIKDTLSSTWSGSFRSVSGVVKQTLSTSGSTRTVTSNPVNWSSSPGWYIDLPISKERMNVDPVLWQGTLVFVTNIPSNDACSVGGSSWMQFVDFATGGMVPGASAAGAFLGDELGTSPAIYNLPKQGESLGGPVGKANSTIVRIPIDPDNQPTIRSHWRELVD